MGRCFGLTVVTALAAVASLAVWAAPAVAVDFDQAPDSPYPAGAQWSDALAAGDMNGDGRDDAVIGLGDPDEVAVMLADEQGRLGPPIHSATPGETTALALADFNGDGHLDAVTGQYRAAPDDDLVAVYLGDGEGGFADTPSWSRLAPPQPTDAVAADLDDDGEQDIALTMGNGTVLVAYGLGDGQFEQEASYPAGTSPMGLVAEDLNGDGLLDLANGDYGSFFSGAFRVLLAQGDRTYAPAPQSPLDGDYRPFDTTGGDFNGDGNADLAQINTPNQGLAIKLGQGDGNFVDAPAPMPEIPSHFGNAIDSHDFTGDGRDDLVTAESGNNQIQIFRGQADGTFTQPDGPWTTSPGTYPWHLALGDLNGDGLEDIVSMDLSANLSVFLNAAPAISVSPTSFGFGPEPVGESSEPVTVEVSNTGSAPLVLEGITWAGDDPGQFAVDASGCESPVPAGGSCDLLVTFTPGQLGPLSAILAIESNAPATPSVQLMFSGTGTPNPGVSVDPTSFDFGEVAGGTGPTPPRQFVVTSTGPTPATVGTPAITGSDAADFGLTANTCTSQLATGQTCSISVEFDPSLPGEKQATLEIPSDADGSPLQVPLTGTATANAVLTVTPGHLDFGGVPIGNGPGERLEVTLGNEGTTPLFPEQTEVLGPDAADFSIVEDGCQGEDVAPGETCAIAVEFEPGSLGAKQAHLSIVTDNPSPALVNLHGEGLPNPGYRLAPDAHDFGSRAPGSGAGEPVAFTLESTGTTPLDAGTASLEGADAGDFTITADGCSGARLDPGMSCQVSVAFSPGSAGAKSARLRVGTGAGQAEAALTGTGQQAPPPPTPCEPVRITKIGGYSPKVKGRPEVLGVRARLRSDRPAVVRISAKVRYTLGGKAKSFDVKRRQLRIKGRYANYKVPLPKRLRARLAPGSGVTLVMRYRSRAASPDCPGYGPNRSRTLRTQVVWITRGGG